MSDNTRFHSKVFCRSCRRDTNHGELYKHSREVDEFEGFYWTEDYIIAQCLGCDTVSFIKEYEDPSMFYVNQEMDGSFEEVYFTDIKVYPEKINQKKSDRTYRKEEFQHLPELLGTLYEQVIANLDMKYYLLAAAGLRMIMEGILNDLEIKKGYVLDEETGEIKTDKDGNKLKSSNLDGRINGLVEENLLTFGQTRILHIIRKVGNQSVHQLNEPSRKIIIAGLEIVEHTFKNIYELKKYDNLALQMKKKVTN